MKFDKQDVSGVLFMMGEKLTDELWEKLTASSITADLSKFDESPEVKSMMVLFAISSLEA